MSQKVDLNEAKTRMAVLIQSAINGEEVIITENDQPILKLVRISKAEAPALLRRIDEPTIKTRRRSGTARGLISISDDFDKPLEDFTEYMQ